MPPTPVVVMALAALFTVGAARSAEPDPAQEPAGEAPPVMQLDAMPMDSRHLGPHTASSDDDGSALVGSGALVVSLGALAALALRRRR